MYPGEDQDSTISKQLDNIINGNGWLRQCESDDVVCSLDPTSMMHRGEFTVVDGEGRHEHGQTSLSSQMTGILSRGQGDCVISRVSKVSPIQSARAPTHCPWESSVATQFTAQSVMNHQQQPVTPIQSDKGIHHRQCTSIYQQHHPSLNGMELPSSPSIYQQHHPSLNGIMELPSSPSIYQQHHPSLNGMELPSSPFWRSSNLQPDFISALAEGQLCQPGSHQAMNTCLETFQTQHRLKYIDQHYMKPHLRNGFDSPNFCMDLSQPFSPHALPEATTPSSHIPLPENAHHQLCYSSTSSSQGMAAAMTPGTPLSGPPLMECSTRKDTHLNLGQGATCTSTTPCSHSESTVTHALDIMKGGSSCRQLNPHTQHAASASHISSSLSPSENYEAINGPSQKVQNAKSKCCRREQESPTSRPLGPPGIRVQGPGIRVQGPGMLSSKNSEQQTFSQVLLQRALLNSFEQRMSTNSKRQRMSKKCGLEHNQCSNSLPNQEALPSNGLLEQSLVPNHTSSPFFASQLMFGTTMPQHPLSSKPTLLKPAQPHGNSNSPSPSPSTSSPTSGDPSQQNSDSQEVKTLFQCLNEGRKQFASHLSSPSRTTTSNINFSQLLSTSLNFSYDDNPVIGHRRRPHRRTGSLAMSKKGAMGSVLQAMSRKGAMGSVLQANHSCDLANGNVLSPSSISTYNNYPASSLSDLQLNAAGTLHSHISPFEITNKRKEAVQGAGTSCLTAATDSATASALSPIAIRWEARIKSLREQLLKVTEEAAPKTLFEEMQMQALKNVQLARERVQQTSLLMNSSASGTSPSNTPAASSPGSGVHAGGSPASITNNYLSCCSSAVSHSSPLCNFSAAAIARTPSEASGLFHSAYEPFAATVLQMSHTDLQIDVAVGGSGPLSPKASDSAAPTVLSHQCLQPMTTSSVPSSLVPGGLTSTHLPSSSSCLMRPLSTVSSATPSLLVVADTSPSSSAATRSTRSSSMAPPAKYNGSPIEAAPITEHKKTFILEDLQQVPPRQSPPPANSTNNSLNLAVTFTRTPTTAVTYTPQNPVVGISLNLLGSTTLHLCSYKRDGLRKAMMIFGLGRWQKMYEWMIDQKFLGITNSCVPLIQQASLELVRMIVPNIEDAAAQKAALLDILGKYESETFVTSGSKRVTLTAFEGMEAQNHNLKWLLPKRLLLLERLSVLVHAIDVIDAAESRVTFTRCQQAQQLRIQAPLPTVSSSNTLLMQPSFLAGGLSAAAAPVVAFQQLLKRKPMLSMRPARWWTAECDIALLRGIHLNGFGSYSALRDDPIIMEAWQKATLCSKAAVVDPAELTPTSTEQASLTTLQSQPSHSLHADQVKTFHESSTNDSGNVLDMLLVCQRLQPGKVERRTPANMEWPSSKTLTKRLQRVMALAETAFASTKASYAHASPQPAADAGLNCDVEGATGWKVAEHDGLTSRKKDLLVSSLSPAATVKETSKWSRKDRLVLLKDWMTWGLPFTSKEISTLAAAAAAAATPASKDKEAIFTIGALLTQQPEAVGVIFPLGGALEPQLEDLGLLGAEAGLVEQLLGAEAGLVEQLLGEHWCSVTKIRCPSLAIKTRESMVKVTLELLREMEEGAEERCLVSDALNVLASTVDVTKPASAKSNMKGRRVNSSQVLGPNSSLRLRERLIHLAVLNQGLEHLRPEWKTDASLLRGPRKTSTGLPGWWKCGQHDEELVQGIQKHGFGNWEAILNDPVFSYVLCAGGHKKQMNTSNVVPWEMKGIESLSEVVDGTTANSAAEGITDWTSPGASLCHQADTDTEEDKDVAAGQNSTWIPTDNSLVNRCKQVAALFQKLLMRPHGLKTAITVKKRSVTALEKEAKLNAAAQAITLDDITAMDDVVATSLSEAHTEGKGDFSAPTRKQRRHSDRTDDDLFKRRAMTIELEDVSPVMSQHASALQHPSRMHFVATEQNASALLNPFHENSLRDGTAPLLAMESASSIRICNGVAQADNILDLNADLDDLDQLLSEFNEDILFL